MKTGRPKPALRSDHLPSGSSIDSEAGSPQPENTATDDFLRPSDLARFRKNWKTEFHADISEDFARQRLSELIEFAMICTQHAGPRINVNQDNEIPKLSKEIDGEL